MKKIFTLLVFVITITSFAQAPQGFNYQATVRNSSGALIVNQNVNFRFNIMLNSSTSLPVYSETHLAPTDDLGQVNLVIGQGSATTGTFSTINWANGIYYLGIEINTGSGYIAMGTTQLLSVPYALYANSSGNSQAPIPNLASVLAVNNGANNLQIKNLADPTDVQDAVTKGHLDAIIANLQAQITALQNANVVPLPNVTIGNQIWQSTNLDVTTYRDGTPIPQVTDPSAWANLTTGAWCYYNNDSANGAIYGKIYNWYAVAGIHDEAALTNLSLRKQLAPEGWHIPTDTEWTTLVQYLDPSASGTSIGSQSFIAGGKLKETGTVHWTNPNTGSTNETGFTALPGGVRSYSGSPGNYTSNFNLLNEHGEWWSITENTTATAWTRAMVYNSPVIQRWSTNKKLGFSVRCIKN
jgi:uncharacterized protein (TIGR02145 family)